MYKKVAVVIPNHLPHLDFIKSWTAMLQDCEVIIMQDGGPKPPAVRGLNYYTVYDHDDVAAELGENAWIIPKQTSACRSYGFYKAWQTGADYILTLDNDCYPECMDSFYWVEGHVKNLSKQVTLDWVSNNDHYPAFPNTRGYPYLIRNQSPVFLSHGLWSNVPDLDAPTWLQDLTVQWEPTYSTKVIPRFNFTPMCGMNLGWRRELTPALWFGLFGPEYGFDQYDDIWAGVLVKRVIDHLGHAMVSGYPSVEHRKQSNVFTNLVKQTPGLLMNEYFWQAVQRVPLTATTIIDTYRELIAGLPDTIEGEPRPGYLSQFKKGALIWTGLFQPNKSS